MDDAPPKPTIIVQSPPRRFALSLPVLVVGAVLVAVAWAAIARACARARRSRTIARSCARAKEHGAILVVLPCRRAELAAHAVFAAFERARCPWRVTVAVYNESAEDVMEVYLARHASQHAVGEFHSRVRVRSIQAESAGPLAAAREAVAQLHSSERFMLLLDEAAEPLDGWDEALCAQWTRLGDANAVLSVPPRQRMAASAAQPAGRRRSAAAEPSSFVDVLRLVRLEGGANPAPEHRPPPGFAVLGAFEHALPRVERATFPSAPRAPVRAIAASAQFAFLPTWLFARAVERAPSVFARPTALYAADVALSSALHAADARFYAPAVELVVTRGADERFRPKSWHRDGVDARVVDPAYAAFAGIDVRERLVTGRGRMGLLDGEDADEIYIKFGSHHEFQRVRRALCGDG